MTIVLNLPMPPSTNRLWRSTRKGFVYKDAKARSWCESAAWEVKIQRKGVTYKGHVAVMLEIEYRADGDLDNKIKATLDMLQQGGLLENDKQVVSLSATWSHDVKGVRITVEETKFPLRAGSKPRRREICPHCGFAFDPRGKPTCTCDDASPAPQKARAAA